MNKDSFDILETKSSDVVVIGGGIAGLWCALKLARGGVKTGLLTYLAKDRGGKQGATIRSVGAISTSPLTHPQFHAFMRELGEGLENPGISELMLGYVAEEIEEIKRYADYQPIKLGVALKGKTSDLIQTLTDEFIAHGGEVVDGWATHIAADTNHCKGIQYQSGTCIGKWLCTRMVIASGGYAGLFGHGIQTPAYGTVFGRFLKAGGGGVNLEFIFKHGYGRPDVEQLTPTEGLPGVEIYDEERNHANWLEKELYYGRGTANHLQAFKYWRRNYRKQFYIDFSYRGLWELLDELVNTSRRNGQSNPDTQAHVLRKISAMSREGDSYTVIDLISRWLNDAEGISFDRFSKLKQYIVPDEDAEVSRIRQIAYFSMGGIYHQCFETNMNNVFVTGEAMHDFGSHRVGGLPWGLYLVSGRFIAEHVISAIDKGEKPRTRDFDLVQALAQFDSKALEEIREQLYLYQEDNFKLEDARRCVSWCRKRRRSLSRQGKELDDAVAWYLVAEAIMVSSITREESRGCFFRADYPSSSERYARYCSYAYYDADSDEMKVDMVARSELFPSYSGPNMDLYDNVMS